MIRNVCLVFIVLVLALSGMACVDSEKETSSPQDNVTTESSPTSPSNPIPADAPSQTQSEPPPPSTAISAMELSTCIADIVELVQPAVVFISAKVETQSFFFNQSSVQTTSGSGVIISPTGYILTNNHVVGDAIELEVSLPGIPEAFEAEVIGTDPLTDLAVIQIEGDDFPTVPFGNASALRPGNLVVAMGYPLALEHGATITLGVVSNT